MGLMHHLTLEIEKCWSHHSGKRISATLDRSGYGRWAWEAWTTMSTNFLLPPLNLLGYIKDKVFQNGIFTYLEQFCPLMPRVLGCYFGKCGEQLDPYGANLAAAPLPGYSHCSLQNKLQLITQAMMKLLGGIHSTAKVVNFWLISSDNPTLRSMSTMLAAIQRRKAQYAIVPDIQVFNFPTGCQQVNDIAEPTLPWMRSLRSKLSLNARANMTTIMLTFCLLIGMCMKLFCLMTISSRS